MTKINKRSLVILFLSVCIFISQFQGLKGQTIFYKDHEAQQEILRNTYLYPNVITARVFQNKVRVYLNKINFNFFALIDINNYFFGFHPGQISVTNQNLFKYPFVTLVFVLYGIYYLKESKNKKFIIISLISSLISLSVLQNFDRNDFILWVPISLLFIYGANLMQIKNKKLWKILSAIFILFAIPQILRSYVEKIS